MEAENGLGITKVNKPTPTVRMKRKWRSMWLVYCFAEQTERLAELFDESKCNVYGDGESGEGVYEGRRRSCVGGCEMGFKKSPQEIFQFFVGA